jgi:dTDP-4-amino-4,6-dideoxygalactose transaminase
MKFKIPFSGRQHEYSDDEVNAVVHAMRNADPLTQGDFLHEFEEKICHYLGVENAFAVCNATAALEMAAQFCGFQEGDEVVIPSHTYTSSAYPFLKKRRNGCLG